MKILFTLITLSTLISCKDNKKIENPKELISSYKFEGKWKCSGGNKTFEFIKINSNSYKLTFLYSGKSITVTKQSEGVLTYGNFSWLMDESTGNIIVPQGYNKLCKTAIRIK